MAGWLKALIITLSVVVGIALILALVIYLIFRAMRNMGKIVEFNNTPLEPDEQVIGDGEKKAIIIYQPSKNGGTTDIVGAIKEVLADYTVTVNYPSEKLEYNLNDYDLIVFGSAIYALHPSECMIEYAQSQKLENKDVFVFVTGLHPEEKEGLEELKNAVGGINNVFGIKVQKTQFDEVKRFLSEKIS